MTGDQPIAIDGATSERFTVSLPYEDYLAANWLMVRRRWMWWGAIRFLLIVGTAYVLIGIAVTAATHPLDREGVLGDFLTAFGLAVAVLAVLQVYWQWCIPRSARKAYAQYGSLDHPTHYAFNDAMFTVENDEGSSKLAWSRLHSWVENPRLMMMFRTQSAFFAVPKDQVDPAAIEKLRRTLVTAGVKKR